ncbi:MAG: four-carbon acid sugar kinase family protein [Planktomarina temperata]|uniref:3-oxo-tetronate kinase n=1 Tax=Planktomarina temperata TaxID=1284658 RepID=UPI002705A57E|nr:four-carbon acid sugar kinase family protein [Planktomarina temperata]
MSILMGCIADDFTGATDLAGLLARSGVPVSLRIGVPEEAPTNPAAFEVIALKCRTSPMDEAVAETRKALAWLKSAGATRFFWKYCSTFDSTPEGNIGPVAEALMADIGTHQTIYCPAFPENGRSIFMGNLFVGEQPLAESPMKDHPLTPMRDSNLMRLLAPQVKGSVGLVNRLIVAQGADAIRARLAQLQADGVAHVVVDAVADADLFSIAEACQDMPLLTGGSAIAMPLPALFTKRQSSESVKQAQMRPATDKAIILSGSSSAMTRQQVARYAATRPSLRLDPIDLALNGSNAALAWLAEQDLTQAPLIYATAEPSQVAEVQNKLGRAKAGEIVEQALAAFAVAARDLGAGRIVVAGGETSGAVTQALGVTRLDVGFEIAPGVPWTFAQSDGKPIALALKSGNFGGPAFFDDALNALEPE